MKLFTDNQNIKVFVRNTLGCSCSEEVFNRIEVEDADSSDSLFDQRITIGGKLLIYICDVTDPENIEEQLLLILTNGINYRDSEGLNRFRLVLATNTINILSVSEITTKIFNEFPGKDDKVHLHVIDINSLRWKKSY